MGSKGNKFGTIKGVFTPSILTILGVIMYLRLPWIVGEAGLIATIGIILVAHLISVSTGLSVASIATDKRVETGGTYFMISRSLGLPIGGTLGLALFVGLSFSVSLYLIGFSETFLTAMGLETTINNIRIAGAVTLLAVTILTFISTSLALKTQFVILAVMALSLVSIFLGRHEFSPAQPLIETASSAIPWIALFAVFFPAVTGFEAGVSMSGDLKDPKRSIPKGTISAILVGLIVYIALAFFFSYTVSRDMLREPSVLYQISLFSPLVIAGVWGATLSSALGSILGAPRILQATAIDRISPKLFAKGFGASNEPRNALFLTFAIAFSGIMIGDLNAIARIVTTFFIITYGFLNLTCAIENLAGSDFRPSFRVPAWIGFLGAFACFVVMIQLDVIAMLAAIVILGLLFLYLKRKELTLQTGDTWAGIWSTLVKTGLFRLSLKSGADKRNWRPNIILFSGSASTRPHLISIARTMVGKLGVFTNFELIEEKSDKKLFTKSGATQTTLDDDGRKVFTRRHVCKDIYEGINTISNVYGFTGFEPNTILLGWGRTTKEPEKFIALVEHLSQLDYNLAFLHYDKDKGFGRKQEIHLWWNEGSNNLNFGITLLKFITADPPWRQAKLKVHFVSYDSSISEKAQSIIRQVLDDQRMYGSIKIVENSIEKKPVDELIKIHSPEADFIILDYELGGKKSEIKTFNNFNKIIETAGTSLIIRAGNIFEPIRLSGKPKLPAANETSAAEDATLPITEQIPYPGKEILANELFAIAADFEELQKQYQQKPIKDMAQELKNTLSSLIELNDWAIAAIEKILKEKEAATRTKNITKLYSDYLFQADRFTSRCEKELLPSLRSHFNIATNTYLNHAIKRLEKVPEKLSVNYEWTAFKAKTNDPILTRIRKFRKRSVAKIFSKQVTRKTPLRRMMTLFLVTKRKESNYHLFRNTGIISFVFLSTVRRNLTETNEILQNKIKLSADIVESNLTLREGKEKLQEINKQILQQITDRFSAMVQQTNTDLFSALKKISYLLGNPESEKNLRMFEKAIGKKVNNIQNSDELPEVLEKNLLLYLNKIHTEFILHSLKARLKSKLSKHAEDLEIMIENRIIGPLGKIKEMAGSLNGEQNSLQSRTFLDEIRNQQAFTLHSSFGRFFKDTQQIINELPAEIEIIQPDFVSDIEKGDFPESSAEIAELQKQVKLFIGRDLTNNLRILLDDTEDRLNSVLKSINDIIRLALFNLENVQKTSEIEKTTGGSDIKDTLIEELLKRIDNESARAEETFQNTFAKMNALLNKSFESLSSELLVRRVKTDKVAQAKNRLFHIRPQIFITIKRGIQKQWVKLIYTRSEGMLFMKRLSQPEVDYKSGSQAAYEIIETLEPNPGLVKKIPFYYTNLFAGDSTINKDLWVGMRKQLQEAEKGIQRFQQGYGGALLITGERNSGKSSLSRYIARDFSSNGTTFIITAPQAGSELVHDLHQAIQKAMNSTLDLDYLLEIQPGQQVFLFNDLELWWQRTPDGSGALEEILRLINKFGKKHLFLINCRTWAYDFINRSFNLEKFFLARIECEPFDARELKQMVMFRHKAGGLKFRLNKKDEDSFSEYDFAQLFNRYFMLSGGNPGYTVKSWISNIVELTGKTLIIRQPQIPDTSNLAELGQEVYMVILQFVLHRRFTVSKLAAVLRQNEDYTSNLVTSMRRSGLIEEKFPGVYALNLLLEPFLVEQLKQKNLL